MHSEPELGTQGRLVRMTSPEALAEWEAGVRESTGDKEGITFLVQPLAKGSLITVRYDSGTLTRAWVEEETLERSDVTRSLKMILTVPLHLETYRSPHPLPVCLQVAGVVYLEKEDPRALGGVREAAVRFLTETDPRKSARDPPAFFCLTPTRWEGPPPRTALEAMEILQRWGLRVNRPHIRPCKGLIRGMEFIRACLDAFPYEVEGAVVEINDYGLQQKMAGRGPVRAAVVGDAFWSFMQGDQG